MSGQAERLAEEVGPLELVCDDRDACPFPVAKARHLVGVERLIRADVEREPVDRRSLLSADLLLKTPAWTSAFRAFVTCRAFVPSRSIAATTWSLRALLPARTCSRAYRSATRAASVPMRPCGRRAQTEPG